MPMTGRRPAPDNGGSLARVNVMREEPGGAGAILRQRSERPALHPRQEDEGVHDLPGLQRPRRPRRALRQAAVRGRVRQRVHQLSVRSRLPRGTASSTRSISRSRPRRARDARQRRACPGLNVAGYTPTPAIRTPGTVEREAVVIEWTDTNITNTTFEGTARELMRVAAEHAHPPDGRSDLQSDGARRRRRLARAVHRLRRRRLRRADAPRCGRTRSGSIRWSARSCASSRISRCTPTTSTVSENGRYRIPRDNPFASTGRRAQGDLGVRLPQSAPADLGRRSGQRGDAPDRREHRPPRVGDHVHRPQGRELRLPGARGQRACCRPDNTHGALPEP